MDEGEARQVAKLLKCCRLYFDAFHPSFDGATVRLEDLVGAPDGVVQQASCLLDGAEMIGVSLYPEALLDKNYMSG